MPILPTIGRSTIQRLWRLKLAVASACGSLTALQQRRSRIDLGALVGSLVAVDGQPIVPVDGATFPITMGQRLDIRVQLPANAAVFSILALREGGPQRTGIVLKSGDASVAKLSGTANAAGPVLDLLLEGQLRAASPFPASEATKTFGLMLSGDMAAYRWALSSDDADPGR